MLAVRLARGVALLMPATGLSPAMAQDGSRALSSPAADYASAGIDRTIVSPFAGNRRIVVRPGPDGGSEVVAVGATVDMPAPASIPSALPLSAAPPPGPAGAFVDIGPLDAAPASVPVPIRTQPIEYLDTGPYDGGVLFAPAPLSSFPPD